MLISACVFRFNVYKKVVFSPAWHRQQVAVFLFCFCRFLQVPTKAENMADEFDVEAMLEAPYRNEVFWFHRDSFKIRQIDLSVQSKVLIVDKSWNKEIDRVLFLLKTKGLCLDLWSILILSLKDIRTHRLSLSEEEATRLFYEQLVMDKLF